MEYDLIDNGDDHDIVGGNDHHPKQQQWPNSNNHNDNSNDCSDYSNRRMSSSINITKRSDDPAITSATITPITSPKITASSNDSKQLFDSHPKATVTKTTLSSNRISKNQGKCHYISSSSYSLVFQYSVLIIIHIVVICIYVIPIYIPSKYNQRQNAVLDELHIVSTSNMDINGYNDDSTTTFMSILRTIFLNDYWGRPIDSPSSHKSWRPLSVLLFRYVRGLQPLMLSSSAFVSRFNKLISNDLNIHRLVNILTHATVAELVSQLAIKIIVFDTSSTTTTAPNHHNSKNDNATQTSNISATNNGTQNASEKSSKKQKMIQYDAKVLFLLRCITKIIFALHPTHVEVTANCANRPHLLALLCSLVLCDPNISYILFIVILSCGYLFCETFLFQIIPISIMIILIKYVQLFHSQQQQQNSNDQSSSSSPSKLLSSKQSTLWKQIILDTILYQRTIMIRLLLLVFSGSMYYYLRYSYDTLSIPSGLIRPAENPFYEFSGFHRFQNYMYILSIHIAKQLDLDFIGFSHEYGYKCIEPITNIYNNTYDLYRLFIPIVQIVLHIVVGIYFILQQRRNNVLSTGFILYIVHLAWTITLFPVSGIIKVGTFIADRLTVASTVSATIITSYNITLWLVRSPSKYVKIRTKIMLLLLALMLMYKRIHVRTCQWMDSLYLLESSLVTCPNFAKGHLEISKIYSGLYKDLYNLTKSRYHLEQVERIDTKYCDVHQQFAHVAIQQQNYYEFEERLTQALLCPFTMAGSIDLWKRYWNLALDTKQNPMDAVTAAQQRFNKYQQRINDAIVRENEQEKQQQEQLRIKDANKHGDNVDKVKKSPFVGWW